MIIKSLSRTSARSGGASALINYMFQDHKMLNQLAYQTRDDNLSHLSVTHLMKGIKVHDWVSEFEENQSKRKSRKGGVIMYHDILSFARMDTDMLNHNKLKDIARQYIQLRSPEAQAVATFHFDARHVHIHVALAGAKYMTGKANRVSKRSFQDIKLTMEEYQREQYPELMHSLVEHGTYLNRKKEQEFQKEKRTRQASKRSLVKQRLAQLIDQAASIEEFQQLCEKVNMSHYFRGDKLYGVEVDGKRYRFSTLGFTDQLETLEQQDFLLSEFEQLRGNDHSRGSRLERLNRLNHQVDKSDEPIPESDQKDNPFLRRDVDLERE